ncbi:DUF1501 domain-containing protein [Aquimarina intermedia]|uniref:Uncharacterized protein (DUF1501 family) n=1 Tax=Aquimarina intermedia TaxID=350814 RepID=A0A5S5C9W1_9FLAO|nr:DUF1501 domain-containing protein [Aquimarina intermedia]TYP76185.1 uncharacterized protein (DUF1501 family) [Aquimarina intermedia]
MCTSNYNPNIRKKGTCNPEDHKPWNRRSFLQALGLAGGGSIMMANTAMSVSKPSPLTMALSQVENDNILILCRLSGGNDGFNTIIPVYDYDVYANARPLIKIPPSEFINLEKDKFAMPKPMNKLESLWGDGQMKVVHGVGYEDPSLSHFQGSDIWANTNFVNEDDRSGWMGRYFQDIYPDYIFNPPPSPPSIQIGSIGNLIFKGPENDFSFAVSSPTRLLQIAENGTSYGFDQLSNCTHGEKAKYLREITNTTFSYAEVIGQAYESSVDFGGYADDSLGRQFNVISRLIKGNLGTKVYMVTLGGFDTHNNQVLRHQELMSQFSEAVSNFYTDLRAAGWDDKVLTMTISEFGRRFNENGSLGTDHGTAAAMMFFGTGLNGNGFVGEHPDLTNLTRGGNVTNTTDFRQVYATVMKEWLCIDPAVAGKAIMGGEFESLDLGFNCSGTTRSPSESDGFDHFVTYEADSQTVINFTALEAGHIDVVLYNIVGQKVATLKNEIVTRGRHKINVKEVVDTQLSTGQYVYRIQTISSSYSKALLIN